MSPATSSASRTTTRPSRAPTRGSGGCSTTPEAGRHGFGWPPRKEKGPLVTLDEAQAVLALLAALKGQRAPAAARALAELFNRRLLLQASEALIRWANGSVSSREAGPRLPSAAAPEGQYPASRAERTRVAAIRKAQNVLFAKEPFVKPNLLAPKPGYRLSQAAATRGGGTLRRVPPRLRLRWLSPSRLQQP
jgi:hypothetical protein